MERKSGPRETPASKKRPARSGRPNKKPRVPRSPTRSKAPRRKYESSRRGASFKKRSAAAKRGAATRKAKQLKRKRAARKSAETRKANREGKRTHFQERVVFATFNQIKNGKRPITPDRVARELRKALKRVAERMRKVYPKAVQDGYFALGLERAVSRKTTGPVWEQEAVPIWTGAKHYLDALGDDTPELLAGDNTGSARPYRVAILAVMADGFIRETRSGFYAANMLDARRKRAT